VLTIWLSTPWRYCIILPLLGQHYLVWLAVIAVLVSISCIGLFPSQTKVVVFMGDGDAVACVAVLGVSATVIDFSTLRPKLSYLNPVSIS